MKFTREQLVNELARRKRVRAFEAQKARGDFDTKYDPTEGMSGLAKLGAGYVGGLQHVGSSAVNLLLPDWATPKWASDEAIAERRRLEKPLEETGAGAVGKFVGEMAGTLPLGLAGGAALRGVQGASKGAQLLARATATPGRQNALRASIAALEGGGSAALTAAPGERGEAALLGAGLGAGLNRLGSAIGRVGHRGLIQKSEDAEELMRKMREAGLDDYIPVAQAAGDQDAATRIGKQFYQSFLPIMPGTTGKLEKQAAKAAANARTLAYVEDMPPNVVREIASLKDPGMQGREVGRVLKSSLSRMFDDTIGTHDFVAPSRFADTLRSKIKTAIPDIDDISLDRAVEDANGLLARFRNGSRITGRNMQNFRTALTRTIGARMGDDPTTGKALQIAKEYTDKIIRDQLQVAGKAASVDTLQHAIESYPAGRVLRKTITAARSKGGNWKPDQLLANMGDSPQLDDMYETARQMATTVGQPISRSNFGGRQLGGLLATATGLGAGSVGFMAAGIPGVAAALSVSPAMATKVVQRALMGDTAMQRILNKVIEKNPELAYTLGAALRNATAAEVGDNSYEP